MSVTLRQPMSRDEFFAWADAQEERYEFDGEQPIAMTGGDIRHSKLMGRLLSWLLAHLDGVRFEVLGPDAGVATIDGHVRYPDVVIGVGATPAQARLVQTPIAMFEIVSPSSSRVDRIIKLGEYGRVASIRHYVILETDAVAATVFNKRLDGAWMASPVTADEAISLDDLAVTIPLAELYQGLAG